VSVSRPGRFIPGVRALVAHSLGWMGPRAGLDAVAKRKNLRIVPAWI